MIRTLGILLAGVCLSSILGGCVIHEHDGRGCRYGWEPEHRDREGRLVGGHCR